MTNELEKRFFDTFGIEPNADIWWCENDNKICDCDYDCDETCRTYKTGYPQITDRILLELICIGTQFFAELVLLTSDNIEDLKEQVLTIYLKTAYKDKLKHQVRTLFEEG